MKEEDIAAYLNNELSGSEREAFEKWLSENEGNLLFYNRIKYIWENSSQISEKTSDGKESTWQSILEKVDKETKRSPRIKRLVEIGRIAAVIVLLLGLSYVTFRILSSNENNSVRYITQASKNQITVLELPDGSHIWLNKGAELLYPENFKNKEREVILEGEAYFEVESDKKHPFLVHSDGLVTEAIGTSFNIKPVVSDNQIIVTLVTGNVILYDSLIQDKSIILEPGSSGLFSGSSRDLKIIEKTNPNFIAWKTGILVFEDTPLEQVCRQLSDHFSVTINCDQELVNKDRSLTARYDNINLDAILEIIGLTLDIKIEKLDSNTYSLRTFY